MNNNVKASSARAVPTNNKWRSWKVNIFVYMVIGLVFFVGSCQVAHLAGWWNTSGKVSVTGENITATGTNPDEIRGFMTIQEVLTAYKVTWEEFSKKFNLPADTALSAPLNTLEKVSPDFSVTKLRDWLKEKISVTGEIPKAAVETPKAAVETPKATVETPKATGETPKATSTNPDDIKGFMTIQDVLTTYKVTWEEFSNKFNLPVETALSSPLNTLEKVSPDFSVTKLRDWLKERAK